MKEWEKKLKGRMEAQLLESLYKLEKEVTDLYRKYMKYRKERDEELAAGQKES